MEKKKLVGDTILNETVLEALGFSYKEHEINEPVKFSDNTGMSDIGFYKIHSLNININSIINHKFNLTKYQDDSYVVLVYNPEKSPFPAPGEHFYTVGELCEYLNKHYKFPLDLSKI